MFDGIPIVNYQETKIEPLLSLTEKLFQKNVFDSYLTPQQLVVLEFIISILKEEDRMKVWGELMKGNLSLNVLNVNHPEEIKPASIEENSDENTGEKEGFIDSHNSEVEDFSQLDLEELKQNISGPTFMGNLSLKIRYVLWQYAIDGVTENDETNVQGNDLTNDDQYLLLDLNDEKKNSTDQNVDIETENANEETLLASVGREDDDYDDYDENSSDEKVELKTEHDNLTNSSQLVEVQKDENNKSILKIEISKDTLSKLRSTNINGILSNWRSIYHNYEYDKETMLKRLKLEKNDELIEAGKSKRSYSDIEEDGPTEDLDTNNDSDRSKIEDDAKYSTEPASKIPKQEKTTIPETLGIASLSLKHLLSSIQENKSELGISDYELKHLLIDVRKNRSKWASDEKIGQEELYEACEKVVLELRNFTEHSTPFLNKVSKREAPNYHQVIKKSMDLNTVLKKLKTFQYTSKQEFVDDIMLIWKNCLTYNSDPAHFLRAHAIAMQKKSLQLLPMIPNITIRNRADVEKEFDEMNKDKDYEEDIDEEAAGSGRKGLNMGAHKPANNESADRSEKENGDKKVPILDRNSEINMDEEEVNSTQSVGQDITKEATPPSESTEDKSVTVNSENGISKEGTWVQDEKTENEDEVEKVTEFQNEHIENEQNKINNDYDGDDDGDEDEDEDEDKIVDSQSYLLEKDDDKDDIEISIWKSLTAKVRAEICLKRSEYFKNETLNSESLAFLKNPQMMKPFNVLFKEYKTQNELEMYSQKLEQQSIMKNGFGTATKFEDSESTLVTTPNPVENSIFDKDLNDIDNMTFLQEYDTVNLYPDVAYSGIDAQELDKQEDAVIQSVIDEGISKKSEYLKNIKKGLTPKLNTNISLIQQIRHICHKISLIRMLQNPLYLQNRRSTNPNSIISAHQYKYNEIDDSIDLDPVSQLSTHDHQNNKDVIWKIMHRNVSKVCMTNGFETSEPAAVNMLTSIAGDYMSNLIKTINIHTESNSLNKSTPNEILYMSLLENGINKPDDLYTYFESEFEKKPRKLTDLKGKLENFLKDLLRPTLQELSERNFDDGSQSFLTGGFASELTGEDFFGFKDLGLEKEFGVLSSSVPLQLLSSQFQVTDGEAKVQVKKLQPEEFENGKYPRISKEFVDSNKYLVVLRPLLAKAYERSKTYTIKPPKGVIIEEKIKRKEPDPEASSYILLEDDEVTLKAKGSARLRLPPTGKISTVYKKKPLSDAFILPEESDEPKFDAPMEDNNAGNNSSFLLSQNDANSSITFDTLNNDDTLGLSNGFTDLEGPNSNSFSLSLPTLDEK